MLDILFRNETYLMRATLTRFIRALNSYEVQGGGTVGLQLQSASALIPLKI